MSDEDQPYIQAVKYPNYLDQTKHRTYFEKKMTQMLDELEQFLRLRAEFETWCDDHGKAA